MRILFLPRQLQEWDECMPILRDVVREASRLYAQEGAEELRITSVHRTEEENTDAGAKTEIHVVGPPYRAIDLGVWELGLRFEPAVERICNTLNKLFDYDPARPGRYNVAYGRPHGSGPHIHLQAHQNTVRRPT